MKHKHYDMIGAWAEGKAIQGKVDGSINWHDIVNPAWDGIEIEYRIKPEPRPQWQQGLIDAAKAGKVIEFKGITRKWYTSGLTAEFLRTYQFEFSDQELYRVKPEPKPDLAFYCKTYFDGKPVKTPMHPIRFTTDNLRLIYDDETGKLKKAEVLE